LARGDDGFDWVSASSTVVEALRCALAGRREIVVALLFGSHARGQARPDSDVDLAVLGRDCDLLGLAADLAEAVKREVDVVDLAQAGYPLMQALLRDSIVVHEGSPHAAAAWRTRAILDTETDRPWFERMRDSYLKRLAERGHD
jgi:predicted nucleotidyltransferase